MEECMETARRVASERENLHFLEKDSIEIGGVLFLGTTLWSRIPEEVLFFVFSGAPFPFGSCSLLVGLTWRRPAQHWRSFSHRGDYNHIFTAKDTPFTPEESNQVHALLVLRRHTHNKEKYQERSLPQMFEENLSWLESQLAQAQVEDRKRVMVLTHHAPMQQGACSPDIGRSFVSLHSPSLVPTYCL